MFDVIECAMGVQPAGIGPGRCVMTAAWPELPERLGPRTRELYTLYRDQFRAWMSGRGVDLAPPIDPLYVARLSCGRA